jgi:hypothetical protein
VVKGVTCVQGCGMGSRVWYMCSGMCSRQYMCSDCDVFEAVYVLRDVFEAVTCVQGCGICALIVMCAQGCAWVAQSEL